MIPRVTFRRGGRGGLSSAVHAKQQSQLVDAWPQKQTPSHLTVPSILLGDGLHPTWHLFWTYPFYMVSRTHYAYAVLPVWHHVDIGDWSRIPTDHSVDLARVREWMRIRECMRVHVHNFLAGPKTDVRLERIVPTKLCNERPVHIFRNPSHTHIHTHIHIHNHTHTHTHTHQKNKSLTASSTLNPDQVPCLGLLLPTHQSMSFT